MVTRKYVILVRSYISLCCFPLRLVTGIHKWSKSWKCTVYHYQTYHFARIVQSSCNVRLGLFSLGPRPTSHCPRLQISDLSTFYSLRFLEYHTFSVSILDSKKCLAYATPWPTYNTYAVLVVCMTMVKWSLVFPTMLKSLPKCPLSYQTCLKPGLEFWGMQMRSHTITHFKSLWEVLFLDTKRKNGNTCRQSMKV